MIPNMKKINGKYKICPNVCFTEVLLSNTKILLNDPAPSTLEKNKLQIRVKLANSSYGQANKTRQIRSFER